MFVTIATWVDLGNFNDSVKLPDLETPWLV